MKKIPKIFLLVIFLLPSSLTIRTISNQISIVSNSLLAQTDNVWTDISEKNIKIKGERRILPLKYRTVESNLIRIKNILQSALFEYIDKAKNSSLIIGLPSPNGELSRFELNEYSMMESGLPSKYPDMKTFTIKGINDPYATGKLDFTMSGFHAMVLTPAVDYYIDPYSSEEREIHIYKRDYVSKNKFECLVSDYFESDNNGNNNVLVTSRAQLRTYRLAVAATG